MKYRLQWYCQATQETITVLDSDDFGKLNKIKSSMRQFGLEIVEIDKLPVEEAKYRLELIR